MTFGEDKDPALVDMIARWTIAMPYVLKAHVTEMKDLSVQLEVHDPQRLRLRMCGYADKSTMYHTARCIMEALRTTNAKLMEQFAMCTLLKCLVNAVLPAQQQMRMSLAVLLYRACCCRMSWSGCTHGTIGRLPL